jgi:hypothetical protein
MDRTRLLASAVVCAFVVAVTVNAVTGATEPARMEFENDTVTLVTADESYDLDLANGDSFEEITVETRPSGAVSLRVTDSVTYDEAFEVTGGNGTFEVNTAEINMSVESEYRLEDPEDDVENSVTVQRVPTNVTVLNATDSERIRGHGVSTNETFDVRVAWGKETEFEGNYIIETEVKDGHEEGTR